MAGWQTTQIMLASEQKQNVCAMASFFPFLFRLDPQTVGWWMHQDSGHVFPSFVSLL